MDRLGKNIATFCQRDISWTSPTTGEIYTIKQMTLGQLLDTQDRLKTLPTFSKIENVANFRESIVALLDGLGLPNAADIIYKLTMAEIGELLGFAITESQKGNPTRPPQGEVTEAAKPLRKKN